MPYEICHETGNLVREKALDEIKPMFAKFAAIGDALTYREQLGGWLFVHEDKSGATWFDPQFTASAVCLHYAARGNGRLI
jgi:hypothetical protein